SQRCSLTLVRLVHCRQPGIDTLPSTIDLPVGNRFYSRQVLRPLENQSLTHRPTLITKLCDVRNAIAKTCFINFEGGTATGELSAQDLHGSKPVVYKDRDRRLCGSVWFV